MLNSLVCLQIQNLKSKIKTDGRGQMGMCIQNKLYYGIDCSSSGFQVVVSIADCDMCNSTSSYNQTVTDASQLVSSG